MVLALGIGSNVGIFSVLNGVLLRPLPYEHPDRLMVVIVLSHAFWTKNMGSNPGVLGTQLALDAMNYTIVGVMPPGFRGIGDQAEVWAPPASIPRAQRTFTDRGSRGLNVLGRLREAVSVARAQAEMDTISRALEQTYGASNEKRGVEVAPLIQETFGPVRAPLLVL